MAQFPRSQCAYHANNILTNFCLREQCLLPLCPSCIKHHSIEHQEKSTDPQYDKQQIENVYSQVWSECNMVRQEVQKVKRKLIEVEKVKRENEKLIIQKVRVYRNRLVREFERALQDMEYQIIRRLKQHSQSTISQLSSLQQSVQSIESTLQQHLTNFTQDRQSSLRNLIFHLSKKLSWEFGARVERIEGEINAMLKRNVCLEIEEGSVEEVKRLVEGFARVRGVEWGKGEGWGNAEEGSQQQLQRLQSEQPHFFNIQSTPV